MPGRLLSHFFGTVELEWIPMSLVALIVLSVGAYYRWERMWQGLFDTMLERVWSAKSDKQIAILGVGIMSGNRI